jgi:hypothetical protein
VLVSGVWNSFIKRGLPVLALALVGLQGGASGRRVIAALLGIAGLAAVVVIFAPILRSEEAGAPVRAAGRPGRLAAAAPGQAAAGGGLGAGHGEVPCPHP